MLGSAGAAVDHPGFSNPGFELGDLTDWTTAPLGADISVVTSTSTLDGQLFDGFLSWVPAEASHFALLRGGATSVYQKLSTVFTAAAGDHVIFSVFLDITEELYGLPNWNDDGYAKLVNTATLAETKLFVASVSTLTRRGNTGWVSVNYVIPAGGLYRLEFAVRNVTDGAFSPIMGVDFPLTATLAKVPAGEMHVHFTALAGVGYAIEYKSTPADPVWLHLADIPASLAPQAIDYHDTTASGSAARFYRVVTTLVP